MSDILDDQTLKDHSQLGNTAFWTAAVRAGESARTDRLINDPWASALAGPEGMAWLAQRPEGSVLPIALRTRFYDDFLKRVTAERGIRQVVLMAAGLDTRAYRLEWPGGTRLFELEQASVLAHKEAILKAAGAQPACARHTIAADLTGPWEDALLQVGYASDRPAVWLLEGFLFYLPCEVITNLLARVSAIAASGSWLGFDIINGLTLTSPFTKSWVEMQAQSGAPWIGYLDNPQGFLADLGWHSSLAAIGGPQANFGRWTGPVAPVQATNLPQMWLVTAEKI